MVKVFSFCLYGPPNPRYYPIPMLQNIELIKTHFPEWKVYLYIAPDVDEGFLSQVSMYSNVVLRPTGKTGSINMIERFFAIDEPDVEIMMVRDADSRIHWKDRWAIRDFLSKPGFLVHTIRDHVEHSIRIMGGLWGMRKISGFTVRTQYELFVKNPIDCGCGVDQSFLNTYIYSYVRNVLLVHVGEGKTFSNEHIVKFPFVYSNSIYCGRVDGPEFVDQDDNSKVRYEKKVIIGGRFKL